MKWLYIGQHSEGTTSRMRAEKLKNILQGWQNDVIDIHEPFYQTHRFFRSFGFRFKRGPLIERINQYIVSHLDSGRYDLIWVDKGVFITRRTADKLRQKTDKLIHYTPDTAFYDNRSSHFYRSMYLYDYLITTKTFEWELYKEKLTEDRLLYATQGYDRDIHKPLYQFDEKENCVAFVGLHERSREELIRFLLDRQIKVKLAGPGWKRFASAYPGGKLLDYQGEFVADAEYTALISSCRFGLGCLSKRFAEQHTTRTFEIPACGTALLTEESPEIAEFYNEYEIIYYKDSNDLVRKIRFYNDHPDQLEKLISQGHKKVQNGGFDYQSILHKLLEQIQNSAS